MPSLCHATFSRERVLKTYWRPWAPTGFFQGGANKESGQNDQGVWGRMSPSPGRGLGAKPPEVGNIF